MINLTKVLSPRMKSEIIRYLGYGNTKPDIQIEKAIYEVYEDLIDICRPRWTAKRLFIEKGNEGIFLEGGFLLKSESLKRNLLNCNEVYLMGASLGIEVDILINRYSKMAISKGLIAEAVANALIEELCDLVQNKLEDEVKREGYYLRPRFSPGYGDLNINFQRDLLNIIQGNKTIGISLTEGMMLVPSKSVTALIGITEEKQNCSVKGCNTCDKRDCEFRRN